MNYHQPDFYHFTEDSIILAAHVSDILTKIITKKNNPPYSSSYIFSILDVCAGCGIVGIETLIKFHSSQAQTTTQFSQVPTFKLDFIELLFDFHPFIEKNVQQLPNYNINLQSTVCILGLFQEVMIANKKTPYDCIVANPPYFIANKNRLSKLNPKKNNCRFFLNGNLNDLILFFDNCLKENGNGFFLCHKDNIDLIQTKKNPMLNKISSKLEIVKSFNDVNIVCIHKSIVD
ncbi:MAG: hypothetical protein HQK51_00570 [Oligoflexia bacterium]|nr:hypothetical protein [Oligoflexia bacterium]